MKFSESKYLQVVPCLFVSLTFKKQLPFEMKLKSTIFSSLTSVFLCGYAYKWQRRGCWNSRNLRKTALKPRNSHLGQNENTADIIWLRLLFMGQTLGLERQNYKNSHTFHRNRKNSSLMVINDHHIVNENLLLQIDKNPTL